MWDDITTTNTPITEVPTATTTGTNTTTTTTAATTGNNEYFLFSLNWHLAYDSGTGKGAKYY